MEDLQKTQNEQMTIKILETNMLLGSDNNILQITEENISKLENIAEEIIQKEPQRKGRPKK